MIKFRAKNFTIPEGHYTGPKDVDEVPGWLETVGKTSLAGNVAGALIGGVRSSDLVKDTKFHQEGSILSNTISGAQKGGLYGALAGIGLKLFLNYLHNPMDSIKYQQVDKSIRQQFGVYQIAGVPIGDSISKNAKVEEKFSFNDRNVTEYKVNVAIHNDTITMYTFGMTNDELNKTSKVLDFYCRKYYGVDYSAKLLNQKMNSYGIDITFNNYQTFVEFLLELSKTLCTKINLLDSKAVVDNRIREADEKIGEEEEARNFSFIPDISFLDVSEMLNSRLLDESKSAFFERLLKGSKRSVKASLPFLASSVILSALDKKQRDKKSIFSKSTMRGDFRNTYLESELNKLYYREGRDYVVDDKSNPVSFSMNSGMFIVIALKGTEEQKKLDQVFKQFWKMHRTESKSVIIYSYNIESRQNFELILKKFMASKIKPNFYK